MKTTASSIFKSLEGQAEYFAAYDRVLSKWPVVLDSFYVTTRYGQTHILACGPRQAPPLVLLPVMSFSSTMWFPNIAELSHSYRTYAIDTVGDLGRSLPSRPIRNRFEYIEWLNEVFNQLAIEKAFVMGESFGAWLTLNLALLAPEHVQRIVLLSPAAGFLLYSLRADLQFGTILFPRFNSKRYWQWVIGERHQVDQLFVDQLSLTRHYKMHSWPVIPMALSDKELRSIKVPTLLLIGECEVINDPRKAIHRAKRLLSNIEAKLIPRVGHIMSMEEPTIVDAHILNFLRLPE